MKPEDMFESRYHIEKDKIVVLDQICLTNSLRDTLLTVLGITSLTVLQGSINVAKSWLASVPLRQIMTYEGSPARHQKFGYSASPYQVATSGEVPCKDQDDPVGQLLVHV